jgi:glutaredoxin
MTSNTSNTSRTSRTSRTTARFYHAGCPVCVEAESSLAGALDPARFDVEIVHLGQERSRIGEAEASGVRSVPALVLDGVPLHINFGASLADLK